jgi:hypothetical protein
MSWAGHIMHMVEVSMHTKFWLETVKRRDHFEDLGIGGRIILKWILKKLGLGMWIGFI